MGHARRPQAVQRRPLRHLRARRPLVRHLHAGTLFEFGFGGAGLREGASRLGWASVAVIVTLVLVRWFFESASD